LELIKANIHQPAELLRYFETTMHRLTACMLAIASALAQDHVVEKVMVPMRDDVKLAADVYRPAMEGKAVDRKFPVLVTRSPYNKNGERRRGIYFAQHGYILIAQDTRGRYASEGEPYPLIHEGRDGYDTIEWAAAQSWSNGKVGTTGASYLAMDQYAAAIERPPHLVAMYAAVGGANYYFDSGYRGGIPGLGWPVWLLLSAGIHMPTAPPPTDSMKWSSIPTTGSASRATSASMS
jgi:putative CocE/NonD family hydrolase